MQRPTTTRPLIATHAVAVAAAVAAPLAAAVGCALLLAACSAGPVHVDEHDRVIQAQGANPNDQRVEYAYGPVASNWERINIDGNDVAWRDRNTDGVIHADHSCERGQDVPLASLMQHLLIGFTDRQVVSEETVPFDGREALHQVIRARLDGVPTMLNLYVMKKDGCVYDLGYVAPPDHYDQGVAAYESFVHGFRTVRTNPPTSGGTAQAGGS